MSCGAVAALEHIEHPISVARRVMERTPHVLLVGEGALQFALEQGFKKEELLTPEAEKAFEKRIALSTPLGRLGEPDHISKTVLFLASDDSAHVQGQELFVDGGATASPSGAPIYRG